MLEYQLPVDVYLCRHDGYVVLMDLARDRYLALESYDAQQLCGRVRGWDILMGSPPAPPVQSSSDQTLQMMLDVGLLAPSSAAGKSARPIHLCSPTDSMIDEDSDFRPEIRSTEVCRFLTAVTSAAMRLKFLSIHHVVHSVQRRRRAQNRSATLLDLELAHDLVGVFGRLSPFVFTARDACLFNSLALLNFLASYGLFPTWVFGVRTGPFAAHCWLQAEAHVLNDTLENICGYTPIMAA